MIKGEIFPNCEDGDLENNIISKLVILLPEPMNQDYNNLEITEFLPDPEGSDSASMPEGEWVELYNSGDSSINLEGLIINDDYGNGLEISQTNVLQNNTIIPPHTYLTIYRNGDGKLTLNNDGLSKVQLFYEDQLLDEATYSNTIERLSWSKVNNNWILTIPSPSEENRIEEPDHSSSLNIKKVYLGNDDKAKFGESIRARVVIYRGDTSKYNIDLYIIDKDDNQVSKRSEINIEEKFTNATMIIPIQLDPNCNGKYYNGTYEVVIKGLEEIEKKEIEIKGIIPSLCEIIKVKEKISSERTSGNLINPSSSSGEETYIQPLTSSIVYQSSDIKARNIGIYFFCAVLLLLIIYLIFKKTL